MSFTYLASPYSHSDPAVREGRFRAACKVAARLMRAGEAVFSPIAHSHPIDGEIGAPQSHEFWMVQDIAVLRHAEVVRVLRLPGWESSRGVAQEMALAHALQIPVEYVDP